MTTAVKDTPRFDEHGRCLPTVAQAGLAHPVSRRYFRLEPQAVDLTAAHGRLKQHLGIEMDARTFVQRVQALRERLATDPHTQGMLAGPAIPFALPQTQVVEIGTLMEEFYLPAIGRAFEQTYPGRQFTNHAKQGLAGKLSVQPGSRHEQLLARQENQEVVGFYFPCLSEYSIPAALEQMAGLPGHCMLSGGFDTSAALVAAPELLMRGDGYPPLLWLSGLAGEKPGVGYHYEAYGYNLTFNRRAHLNQVAEYWWSSVTVIDSL